MEACSQNSEITSPYCFPLFWWQVLFCVWYTQHLRGNEAQVQDEKKITSQKSFNWKSGWHECGNSRWIALWSTVGEEKSIEWLWSEIHQLSTWTVYWLGCIWPAQTTWRAILWIAVAIIIFRRLFSKHTWDHVNTSPRHIHTHTRIRRINYTL